MRSALWHLNAAIRGYLRFYMPTNRAVDWLRTPHGLKWAIPGRARSNARLPRPNRGGHPIRRPSRPRLPQRAGVPVLLERCKVRLDGGAVPDDWPSASIRLCRWPLKVLRLIGAR